MGRERSLPIVIICHAAIDTAGRYMLPEFSNGDYQLVWLMVGLYAVIAVIVVLVAGPKRLITTIPRRNASD